MAKRKRKSGGGIKFQSRKTYEESEFIPYIHAAEGGIMSFWQAMPDLTDGDVRKALRGLVKSIQNWDVPQEQPADLIGEDTVVLGPTADDKTSLLQVAILEGVREAFDEAGPLTVEDLIGVLKRINYSVGSMNLGMRQQNYLHYVQGFRGQLTGENPGYLARIQEQGMRYFSTSGKR